MNPARDTALRRFPLVARPRPPCIPLTERVADLCQRARQAERDNDPTGASAVHNLAALLASDCGRPDVARQWCHQHAALYLHAHPLDAPAARRALEPVINLARLHIRAGRGQRAFDLIDTLYTAVSTNTSTTIDGLDIPADLTQSADAHRETCRWLWAVYLATAARALATADRWHDAYTHLRAHKGIGHRMLDGRQIAVIAHAMSENDDKALALLAATTPGEPWENAVTAVLNLLCHNSLTESNLDTLTEPFHQLTTTPGLAVFHTRLGLSLIDAIGTTEKRHAHAIATNLIARTTTTPDGYTARDILAHPGCRALLTADQTQRLTELVETCALDRKIPAGTLLTELTAALADAETIIAGTNTPRCASDHDEPQTGASPNRPTFVDRALATNSN